MSKKSHHFLTLWPWPLTYDLEKLIRSGHYHYQCVYQIWEQSIPWFLSYRVNTIAGGGRRVAGGGRLWRKTITSLDPSDTGDIINDAQVLWRHIEMCVINWVTCCTNPTMFQSHIPQCVKTIFSLKFMGSLCHVNNIFTLVMNYLLPHSREILVFICPIFGPAHESFSISAHQSWNPVQW